MQAALSFSASMAGAPLAARPVAGAGRPAALAPRSPPSQPRRSAPRSSLAVRAAAKSYICIDCGWLYVPDKQGGVAFESLKSFK